MQVTHLQALNEYLDLFGAVKINKLPKGTRQPPQDNPQIYLGNISIELPSIPFWTTPPSDDLKARLEIPFQNTSTTFPTLQSLSYHYGTTPSFFTLYQTPSFHSRFSDLLLDPRSRLSHSYDHPCRTDHRICRIR